MEPIDEATVFTKEWVRMSILLKHEHVRMLDELSKEYDGNRSMTLRKLIEREMERKLEE